MSSSSNSLRRGRLSGVQRPRSGLAVAWEMLKRADVLSRIGMCLLAAVLVWLITRGWQPPFAFREGDVPARDITARVLFETPDKAETDSARERARLRVVTIYKHDETLVSHLREQLLDKVRQIVRAESLEELEGGVWEEFMIVPDDSGDDAASTIPPAESFQRFREALAEDEGLEAYAEAVRRAMSRVEEFGMLENLQHDFDVEGGSQKEIRVDGAEVVQVADVRIEQVRDDLRESLGRELDSPVLAEHTFAWFMLKDRLKPTLIYDKDASRREADEAAAKVAVVMQQHQPGDQLASGGVPLSSESIQLLRKEYEAAMSQMAWTRKAAYSAANFGFYAAIYLLCGFYCVHRQRRVLQDPAALMRVLALAVVTVLLCWCEPREWSEMVIIPLLLFGMVLAIAFDQELALLLSAAMAMVVVVSLGFRLTEFTIYVGGISTAVLCLADVRSRTKLIYVGMTAAAVTSATAVGVGTLADPLQGVQLLTSAAWYGFFALVAGLLMTGLLPFIERLFQIQTELSLLELGDVSHPLLQELVRRAPGTYNHSITVASLAEAAAEAIGANGLLVRVGAYFHDIGKMLKPGYFIENQRDGDNRHESLLPAMSTLVIIAHVKDGADLAKQHGLPRPLVDFIMQHHGTTLVEYFYNRASLQKESNPDGGEVDEHSYRYPGPKPQTKEAAVLMLADAVESAGRTLSDPTASRIEGLVHDLAMKRLLDGQFDDCGLTLRELRQIEACLTKSLSAVYHGRIKYPDQQSA